MPPSTAAMSEGNTRSVVAPWWHTLLVLLPLAMGSVASGYQHGLEHANVPGISIRLSSYFTILVEEWFVVLLIWLGLRRRGLSINSLVSGHWQSLGTFFRDLGIAVGFLIVSLPLIGVLTYLLGGSTNRTLANITPKTGFELVIWLCMAATAGFCEELIFRGYLTQQFSAWTGRRMFALALQGVLFGLAHGYYFKAMVVVMVEGWLLGLLAYWRKSLRPGMLVHGLQDTLGGLVGFLS